MGRALFVIDMQEVTVGKDHAKMFDYDGGLLAAVNRVIDENRGSTVVYIRNLMKRNLINKLAPVHVYEGSKEAEFAEGLRIVSDNVFDKFTGDAFSNRELCDFLKANGVTEIEVIGVDGGGCVALTALGAVKNGYSVTLNTKAIGTVMERKKDTYFEKLKKLGAEFK